MSSASCEDSAGKCQHCQQLEERVDQQDEIIEELRAEVAQLKDEQADHQEQTARQRAEDRQRITDVEDRVEDLEDGHNTQDTTGEDGPADGHDRPQTPLEQTAGLPQEMIDQESANVRRAVFVARDVHDYTQKVPAGRVIKSSDLRKVLKAGTDAKGHTQTVGRVMEVLDDLGGDDVRIVDRRGQRRVVFTDEMADRLDRLTQASGQASNGVVARGRS